jgi:hypothetical protein
MKAKNNKKLARNIFHISIINNLANSSSFNLRRLQQATFPDQRGTPIGCYKPVAGQPQTAKG